MLTCKLDIDDRLENGALGQVMQFKLADDQAKIAYIKFNHESAGKK